MDIDTFEQLNPTELKELSVDDVYKLLGRSLPDLKERAANPAIHSWIQSQLQSELDNLGIGLKGGRPLVQPDPVKPPGFIIVPLPQGSGTSISSFSLQHILKVFLSAIVITALQRVL
ncbi:mesothelin-like [Latimeria chalumnae]|uniref:mesothelin-like n=1 Tax=Latimeria chalumnae TaxID=7897 RepID=UPI0003C159EA|nr:PREDICTED: mesothelin-like [Latimeria chalumnae]|eukprot:XP_006014249.1 PREDICTED: mesothelin-like [Latimeria chalumnae]